MFVIAAAAATGTNVVASRRQVWREWSPEAEAKPEQ